MKVDWKSSTILPDRRIRVLTCDSLGFMQTAFYGRPSNILDMRPEGWYSDEVNNEQALADVQWWDYLPADAPIKVSRAFPEDPLVTQGAPPNNYPENQGMGAALGLALENARSIHTPGTNCPCLFCEMGIPITLKKA